MSATEEATQMIVEEAVPAKNNKAQASKSKSKTSTKKPAVETPTKEAAPKEEGKTKKKGRKADRTNFTTAIRKIAKRVLEENSDVHVTKAKKGFYDQVNYALIEWLKTVAKNAASFSNTRKKAKTITMRDMYSALKASLCINSNFDKDADGYRNLEQCLEKVGGDRAGPSKEVLVKRLVDAYGEAYNFTRTRTVKGKEVTTTLINPSRVSSLFLKNLGVERVAVGVASLLAFHAQVVVIEFLNEIANIAEFFKTKTMTMNHLARAYRDCWYSRYLFGSSKSAIASIPVVLDPVVLPTKKSLLEAKREGKRKWREAHAELLPYLRKQKRANKGGAVAKPSSSVKKTSSAKKPKTAKKASASKSRSKSKSVKKSASKTKSKSQSKPKSSANKKSASAKKPKTAASKVKKNTGNGTAAKKVKA